MRIHRFFVSQPIDDQKEVTLHDSSLFHQLKNVFRFTVGGQVILLDNSGFEYHAMIYGFNNGNVTFSIVSKRMSKNIPEREVYLFFSLIKKDKLEWILEKGTELGITRFIPIISDRSEKKDFNMERAEKILKEASEQSGRATIPTISETVEFANVLPQEFPCFAFDPKGNVFTVEHAQKFSPLGIFIGPEGGWTDKEIFLFKKHDVKVYSLGTQILRAETAAVAISSLILLQ
jgi:16S rRNA (uracil1498-N3)-methyltransferase